MLHAAPPGMKYRFRLVITLNAQRNHNRGFSLKPFRGLPYPQSLSPPLLASASTVCPWRRRWRYAPNPSPPSAVFASHAPYTTRAILPVQATLLKRVQVSLLNGTLRFLAPRLNADGLAIGKHPAIRQFYTFKVIMIGSVDRNIIQVL